MVGHSIWMNSKESVELDMDENQKHELKELIREVVEEELDKYRVHQSAIIPRAVKERHLDFGVRTAGDLLKVDSEKRIVLMNSGIPDTGWAITNKTEDKTLNCNVGDTLVTSDVLGTLIDVLIAMGILSA